ncbi:hypothetical protein GE061_011575 [Apolygus lucorum]|uniref:Reverse transcriptase domain-containing protein n=1 Tax=Apolygus lucorum TaxID=248454 RepID=A0A8S9XZV2_APOLU|nr:hypothetical protein GE061_011575 [Apolygus lucorum]
MNESYHDNKKLFYKVLKNMRKLKDCPIKFVKSKAGLLLTDTEDIMRRWKEYFQELLDCGSADLHADEETEPQVEGDNGPDITIEELLTAINKVKLGKSAGEDGITPEMIRYMGKEGQQLLLRVIKLAWRTKSIPSDWEECKPYTKKYVIGNWKMRQVCISELAFADDVALIASRADYLQHNLNQWEEEMKKRNMIISTTKTKSMIISRSPAQHMIQLSGQRLEQVDSFKYLGATIRQDGSIDQEIGDRIAATGRLYHGINRGFIGKREVSKPTKMVVFKTIYTPTLTHSSESWALSSKHRSRLQAVEMRYLRRVEGKTRRDRVRNQTIRSSLDGALGVHWSCNLTSRRALLMNNGNRSDPVNLFLVVDYSWLPLHELTSTHELEDLSIFNL